MNRGGGKTEKKPLKPFLSDMLSTLCSVMGITDNYNNSKIISLHRKSSEVAEVKKSLATYAFIDEMASKR